MALFKKKKSNNDVKINLLPPTEPLGFSVAGTKYYVLEIENFGIINDDYNLPTDDFLSKYGYGGGGCYQYVFPNLNISFKSEPENPQDPNAIMVLIDDVKVGYVPAIFTDEFRRYASYPCNITYRVTGGRKMYLEPVIDKVNDTVSFEHKIDITPYYIYIEITPL